MRKRTRVFNDRAGNDTVLLLPRVQSIKCSTCRQTDSQSPARARRRRNNELIMFSIIVVLVLLTAGYKAETYDNQPNGILYKTCPEDQLVSMIKSSYDDGDKDRQWKIECKDFGKLSNCVWFRFDNLHHQELQFNCPADHVINSIHSVYDTNNEDRNWSFRCCTAALLTTFECRETSKVNFFKEDFTWHVPGGNFLKGFSTHGRNDNGDHRWSFSYCRAVIMDSETPSPILVANSPTQHSETDGDIVVHSRDKRSVKVCEPENCFWSKGANGLVQVPYTISDTFTNNENSTIEKAMNEFHLSSCVRFVPRKSQINYVSIVKKDGCWSKVGRRGGEQELSLGYNCVNNGHIQHELMHALGFWHEQSRSDRDVYVKINLDNVKDEHVSNFDRKETLNLNVPYDYSSLMHYGRTEFSKNGQDTVTPVIASASIGQRNGMTENDFLKINKLYNCKNYLHKRGEWDSEVGQSFTCQCPKGQAVSSITSAYDSIEKDRHWAVTCKALEKTHVCQWSTFTNQAWHDINFECGDNSVIAGVHSVYNHMMQDRIWKFYCCRASATVSLSNLKHTPLVNFYGEYFSWKVASINYITAVKSSFDTTTRDRRWSFSYQQRSVE
ncbi:high choriolytic enzyme 1-like [Solea senegalensis]|uniref:High choriolytic enzyme 1-like n=3 Tax=Solea senegalensis TaxID=28829 RepID=A0AAV6QM42_SOLSE|nr:high choriolytic enzyme 1-like [Solea senegalensis]